MKLYKVGDKDLPTIIIEAVSVEEALRKARKIDKDYVWVQRTCFI